MSDMQDPITVLADGTIKQVSPFNGTQVWTVPGRANRPFVNRDLVPEPIDWSLHGRFCSFCEHRYLDSPPEKARLVAEESGTGYRTLRHVPASELNATVAAFRRVPNLFPILPLSYWQTNYGLTLNSEAQAWRHAYLSDSAGREHLRFVAHRLALAAGMSQSQWNALNSTNQLALSETFFGSCHDLIIGYRHFSAGATTTDQLASSGTLSPDEHAAYIAFAVDSAHQLQEANPFASYVAIFQNWLRPAGASFDHLHKQLAAIDQLPVQFEAELARLHTQPDLYQRYGIDYAERNHLIVARNDYAVAFAGYGHRYPSVEIHSLSPVGRPWELSEAELGGLSDLIHAIHLATGVGTPCNEEWHYQPSSSHLPSPVRVVIKWRISTLAGFEGATKIYLNTMSPWTVRDLIRDRLRDSTNHRAQVDPG